MRQPTSPSGDALFDSASMLARAAAAGHGQPLLRGKYIALVCDDADSDDAQAFRRAATELGARVARILPSTVTLQDGVDSGTLGHMLSMLYDAVECQGVPAERVDALRRSARIPVFDGLTRQTGAQASADSDSQHYLLQAALLASFG